MKHCLLCLGALLMCSFFSKTNAQCTPGEVAVTFVMNTDAWGYEAYWQLTLAGDDCDVNPILIEGNDTQVSCETGGSQVSTGGNGYPNNSSITLEDVCLTEGQAYTIHYVDDWGDGGLSFDLFIDGVQFATFTGNGSGNVFEFTAELPDGPLVDFPCGSEQLFVGGTPAEGNNDAATTQNGEPVPNDGGCAFPGDWCENDLDNTIWFRIIPETDDPLLITTCVEGTDFDTQMALYSVDDCLDFDTYELIAANDDGGCGIANGFASTFTTSCLEAGTEYYLQIDGWNGDQGNVFVTATIADPSPELGAQVNSISCAPDKGESGDGSIRAFITDGGEDFVCVWSGPNGFSSDEQDLEDLDAGEYVLTATDACGNVFTESFTIIVPSPIQVSFSLENPECPLSADGSITPNVSGGTLPYQFFWSGPELFESEEEINDNLNEGTYSLVLLDDNGCEYGADVNLNALNEVNLNLGSDTTICLEDQFVLNGPLGYQYSWQDESTNQFFLVDGEALGVGTHSFILSVENEFGCSALDAISVTVDVCDNVEEALLGFECYPNPAQDVLTIKSTEAQGEVSIWSAHGKWIKSVPMNDYIKTISIADLAAGTYLMRYTLSEGRATQRMIVKQ